MTKRLEILEKSLEKKKAQLNRKLSAHFADVKSGNGQPMNDKRNGQATLNRWERQNDALRNLKAGIQKTKEAIEYERQTIKYVDRIKSDLPGPILDLIESGDLTQWTKYPNMFFVPGVDKARIIWDSKTKQLSHKYVSQIPDKEQYAIFRDAFNTLKGKL